MVAASNLSSPKALDTELRVWFKEKEQVLWWVIDLQDSIGKETTVYLDAHTDEIFSVLQPLYGCSKEKTSLFTIRELQEIKDVLKSLYQAQLIEVVPICFAPPELLLKIIGKADKKDNPKELRALLEQIRKSIRKSEKSLRPGGLRYAYPVELRIYAPKGDLFVCYYSPKEALLEIHPFKIISPQQIGRWQHDKFIKTEKHGPRTFYYVKDVTRPIYKWRRIEKKGKNYYFTGTSFCIEVTKELYQIVRKICKQWSLMIDEK